jgi:hypothetical protein
MLPNFDNEVREGLTDVGRLYDRGLKKMAAKALCKFTTL